MNRSVSPVHLNDDDVARVRLAELDLIHTLAYVHDQCTEAQRPLDKAPPTVGGAEITAAQPENHIAREGLVLDVDVVGGSKVPHVLDVHAEVGVLSALEPDLGRQQTTHP